MTDSALSVNVYRRITRVDVNKFTFMIDVFVKKISPMKRQTALVHDGFKRKNTAYLSWAIFSKWCLAVPLLISLTSCSVLPHATSEATTAEQKLQNTRALAQKFGWQMQVIQGTAFDLVSFLPVRTTPSRSVVIFLEGDGSAWLTRYQPSSNPTPTDPIGLKLALHHPDNNAIYLARPCQYIQNAQCHAAVWTGQRFSETVIAATNQAIDALKQQLQFESMQLVGYSGGGVVAALVAARRQDVELLITIAAPLDIDSWTELHHVSALTGSLNPINYRRQLEATTQRHFVGQQDRIVPAEVVEKYVAGFPEKSAVRMIKLTDTDHHCCWVEQWPQLFHRYIEKYFAESIH